MLCAVLELRQDLRACSKWDDKWAGVINTLGSWLPLTHFLNNPFQFFLKLGVTLIFIFKNQSAKSQFGNWVWTQLKTLLGAYYEVTAFIHSSHLPVTAKAFLALKQSYSPLTHVCKLLQKRKDKGILSFT